MKIVPVKIRLVKYKREETTYVLGSTLLDTEIKISDYADVYHSRWGVEEHFKIFKTMLNAEHLRAKSEIGVLQEIYANFTLTTLCRAFSNDAEALFKGNLEKADSRDKVKVQINFQNVLLTVQKQITGLFSVSKEVLTRTVAKVFNGISRAYQAVRPNRSYERKSVRPLKRFRGAM